MKGILIVWFLGISVFVVGQNSETTFLDASQVMARLELNRLGPVLVMEATVQNLSEKIEAVDYMLETYKLGVSGDSYTTQKGKCKIVPLQCLLVSQSRVSAKAIVKLKIKIKILQENIIIAQDSVVFHGDIH